MSRDAQDQSYWQCCRAGDFELIGPSARWEDASHALTLGTELGERPASVRPVQTRTAAARPAIAIDAYGSWARVSPRNVPTPDRIGAGGAVEPETQIFEAPDAARDIVDVRATTQDWLVILTEGGTVIVRDLANRFEDVTLSEPGFSPDRVAETPDGRLWLIDRAGKAWRRLRGDPLPRRVRARERAATVFQPRPLDPDPIRFERPALASLAGIGEEIIDVTALDDGRLAILGLGPGRRSLLRLADGVTHTTALELDGLQSAHSIANYGGGRLVALVPHADKAVMIRHLEGDRFTLMGIHLPLRNARPGRLCNTLPGAPVAYPALPASPPAGGPPRPFNRLIAPSRPSFARRATARALLMEGDAPGHVWHRLYLEASLPTGCGITVMIAADDDASALLALPKSEMHPHRFGTTETADGPQGVWLDQDSERPWLSSALGRPRKRERCGLFSTLVQKPDGAVRRIKGRFLRLELVLNGPGLATPRLHAVRIWGARQSLRDRYLPDYLSVEEGPQAEGSDFLERYLALFESILTPIEDEVAASYRLTRPDSTPGDALDWLANWIGAELDGAMTETAKRRLLAQSVPLWRRRGTFDGLRRMLDIVTDGGVARGELVVLEHFHLRRTFATILGADLSDSDNPLTPGARSSGNSHLGQSFYLGAEDQRVFFALFRPELVDDPLTTAEERSTALDQLEEFFDSHAFRITVLVHGQMSQTHRDLISRVLDREVPAHVVATMAQGPGSLVLALSSLVGVDTHPSPAPPPNELTLGEAQIGQVHLTDAHTLDPRFEGGA